MTQASILRYAYVKVLKPIFFLSDPERVHDSMTWMGKELGKSALGKAMTRRLFHYEHPMLRQDVLGLHFENPIGLSAGFDKNAELTDILPSVGFGFVEVGSITGNPCAGNPKPRLWRLPKSKGLVVYYGLKNDGCEAIANRLSGKHFDFPLGASVAMTNCKENNDLETGVSDFAKAFKTMEPSAGYLTINISCPNTEGGQPFTDPAKFSRLMDVIDAIPTAKPIFIKLSPDLAKETLDAILEIARAHRVHGIICTNLTKKRDNPLILDTGLPPVGGISGKVVQNLSDEMLAYIYKKEGSRFVLVGCGGVFNAEDAYKKIRLGATLIQMITGMIFEGPQVVGEINRGLVTLLRKDGFQSIAEAIGVDNR